MNTPRQSAGIADAGPLNTLNKGPTSDPHAGDIDKTAVGTRQPPHGVSQEESSNAMVTHPTEVGGTRPSPPQPSEADVPKPAK